MKILKRTVIALSALVAVVLGVAAWFILTADARLERQLAAIRAAGDPVTLADLARKPIPPATNADTYLRQAEPGVKAICDLLYPDTNNSVVKRLAGAVQSVLRRDHRSLKRAFEKVSGRSLDRFFDQWVYQSGHLDLQVKSVTNRRRTVSAEQKLAEGAPPLQWTFEIDLRPASGKLRRLSKVVSDRQATHVVALEERPRRYCIDPSFALHRP